MCIFGVVLSTNWRRLYVMALTTQSYYMKFLHLSSLISYRSSTLNVFLERAAMLPFLPSSQDSPTTSRVCSLFDAQDMDFLACILISTLCTP